MCTLGETLKALQVAIDQLAKAKAQLVEHARGGYPDTEDACFTQTAKLKRVQRDVFYELKEFNYQRDKLPDTHQTLFCEEGRKYCREFKYVMDYTHEDMDSYE